MLNLLSEKDKSLIFSYISNYGPSRDSETYGEMADISLYRRWIGCAVYDITKFFAYINSKK